MRRMTSRQKDDTQSGQVSVSAKGQSRLFNGKLSLYCPVGPSQAFFRWAISWMY